MLLKRDLRAAGDKAKPTATFMGNTPPVPFSSASWLPRTPLLLAPEDHGPVGWEQLCQCPFASATQVAETRWHCRSLNRSTDIISLVILTEVSSLSCCTYLLLMKELSMPVENGELSPGTRPYMLFLSSLDLAQFRSTPEPMNKSTYKRDCDSDIRHLTAFSRSSAPVTESSHPFQKKQSPVLLPMSAVECFAAQCITVFLHVSPPHPLLGVTPA